MQGRRQGRGRRPRARREAVPVRVQLVGRADGARCGGAAGGSVSTQRNRPRPCPRPGGHRRPRGPEGRRRAESCSHAIPTHAADHRPGRRGGARPSEQAQTPRHRRQHAPAVQVPAPSLRDGRDPVPGPQGPAQASPRAPLHLRRRALRADDERSSIDAHRLREGPRGVRACRSARTRSSTARRSIDATRTPSRSTPSRKAPRPLHRGGVRPPCGDVVRRDEDIELVNRGRGWGPCRRTAGWPVIERRRRRRRYGVAARVSCWRVARATLRGG